MSKANNLTDFLTDVADAIRTKKGTGAQINPQDFSNEINSIETGGNEHKTVQTAHGNFTNNVIDKTGNGLTGFNGMDVGTDGQNIYYSSGSTQKILDKNTSTGVDKTWYNGTSFDGRYIGTDGQNIYYSLTSTHKILNKSTSTGTDKIWYGEEKVITNLYPGDIGNDGENIYCSHHDLNDSTKRYTAVLNTETSTGTIKTGTYTPYGLSGSYIGTDGDDIYFSNPSSSASRTAYLLDKANDSGTQITGDSSSYGSDIQGYNIGTDGMNIYHTDGSTYTTMFDKKTKTGKSTSIKGTDYRNYQGRYIGTDGDNFYLNSSSLSKVFEKRQVVYPIIHMKPFLK